MNGKRVLAGFIDFNVSCFIQSFLLFLLVGMMTYLKIKLPFWQMLLVCFATTQLSLLYLYLRDFFGISVGKRIIKLSVYGADGRPAVKKQLLLRNITWLVAPVDVGFYVFKGRRIGDVISKTEVR